MYNPTRTRDHNYTPAKYSYNPRFVVFEDGRTIETDVTIYQVGKQSITGDTATLGYFADDDRCYQTVLKASKRNGKLYWQIDGSHLLGTRVCIKRNHVH